MLRYIPVMICMVFNSLIVNAADLVPDTQAFLYYKIPFDGATPEDRAHQYGIRMDRSHIERDKAIDMKQLMTRNAVMDFKMSSQSPAKFEVHGVDYLPRYRILKADAGASDSGEEAVVAEDMVTEGEAQAESMEEAAEEETVATGEEAAQQTEEAAPPEKGALDEIPAGVLIGVAALAAILAGAGG